MNSSGIINFNFLTSTHLPLRVQENSKAILGSEPWNLSKKESHMAFSKIYMATSLAKIIVVFSGSSISTKPPILYYVQR
jgi:hypothetical protein